MRTIQVQNGGNSVERSYWNLIKPVTACQLSKDDYSSNHPVPVIKHRLRRKRRSVDKIREEVLDAAHSIQNGRISIWQRGGFQSKNFTVRWRRWLVRVKDSGSIWWILITAGSLWFK